MPQDATALFDSWLDRMEAGEEADFEALVREHPDLGGTLRELHRSWQALQADLESALPGPLPTESFFRAPAAPPPGPAVPLEPGLVLGDFRLIRPLGQGGMGSVWEAEQVSLGRRVALKLLRPGRGAPRLLVREARVAGRLDHPGLVPVHAVGAADGTPYIAQQLVGDGFTLADFLDRVRRLDRPPPDHDRRVARLVADVADAVHAAHEAGVMHRDLKPQNILIDDEDRPRVTDFGLAHEAAEDEDIARPGLVGTLAYMSPEQAGGRELEIDRRSDVFSLGAVLWEALTLRRAFDGDSAQEVLWAVLHDDPPDPRRIRPRVPRDLAAICTKSLRKARDQRYGTMRELAEDLRRFLRAEPVQAEPESALALAWKWSRRHPAWVASLALGGAALVVISGLLLHEIDLRKDAQDARDSAAEHAQQAEDAATLAQQRAAEARRQSYLANLRAADAALAQGGWAEARRVLEACPEEHRGWEWHHLWLRSQASLLALQPGGGAVLATAMTPDGRRVVTGCADGTLHVWDGETGARLGVLDGHGGAVNAVAITDDGARAVAGGADGIVRVWDVEHGRPLAELPGHTLPVLAVACDAGGDLIVSGSEDGSARVWRPAHAEPQVLEPMLHAAVSSVAVSPDGSTVVTGTRYGAIEAWYPATGRLRTRLVLYEAPDVPLALSPDGTRVASGGADGKVRVRAVEDGTQIFEFAAHDSAVGRVTWSRDGARLITIPTSGGELRVFSTVDGQPLPGRSGQEGRLLSLATDASGERVVAGGSQGLAWLWLRSAPPQGPELPRLGGPVLSLACDDDGARLLVAALGTVGGRLLDLGAGGPGLTLADAAGAPSAVALDGQGRVAALATLRDPDVRVLDVATGRESARLAGPPGGVTGLALSADGRTLLAAARDGRIYVWSLPDGTPRPTLSGHESIVSSVALSADGRRAASASLDGTVRLWDVAVAQGRVLTAAAWYEDALVALSADGRRVASASIHSDTATVWNADTGEVLCTLPGHGTGVGALLLSPDGTRVLSTSGREAAIRVWDARSGELLLLLTGHDAPVTALAMSGNGRRLVSGGKDGALRVWDAGD
ncbi:MAG TPA: serine/threonine-protein kinase [Planctomycetota bacterium]|nr:serine/threonine-protein kinase [Planctomycetota bacterium]